MVVSIAPLHSLVQGVMEGIGDVELLLNSTDSPHGASLSPSLVRRVSNADLLVWVGPELETALERVVRGSDALQQISMLQLDSMVLLHSRESGIFTSSTHTDSDAKHEHFIDPHLWLSPHNAAVLVTALTNWLVQNDASNSAEYQRNSRTVLEKINMVRLRGKQQLGNSSLGRYIIYHDAYQYFEAEFSIQPLATVTTHPEHPIGARRITELKRFVQDNNVLCLFVEPQFAFKAVDTIVQDLGIQVRNLDPLGSQLEPGPDLWFDLIDHIVAQFNNCTSKQ